jgi:hypothetical protein
LINTQRFNVVQVFFLIMSHHNLEQISEETMTLSCAGVFISPELIKQLKSVVFIEICLGLMEIHFQCKCPIHGDA